MGANKVTLFDRSWGGPHRCASAAETVVRRDRGLLRWKGGKPEPIRPDHARATMRDFERAYRKSNRRVRNRIAAAQMVMPYFREALGLPTSQAPRVSQLSHHEMAELALNDMLESNPHSIRSRVWARTQPVLHIATAAAIYDEIKGAGEPPIDFAHILVNVRVAKRVLHLADRILPILQKIKQVDLANVDFVRVQVEG